MVAMLTSERISLTYVTTVSHQLSFGSGVSAKVALSAVLLMLVTPTALLANWYQRRDGSQGDYLKVDGPSPSSSSTKDDYGSPTSPTQVRCSPYASVCVLVCRVRRVLASVHAWSAEWMCVCARV